MLHNGWIAEQRVLIDMYNELVDEFESHYSMERMARPHFFDLHTNDDLLLALSHLRTGGKIEVIRSELERRGVI